MSRLDMLRKLRDGLERELRDRKARGVRSVGIGGRGGNAILVVDVDSSFEENDLQEFEGMQVVIISTGDAIAHSGRMQTDDG